MRVVWVVLLFILSTAWVHETNAASTINLGLFGACKISILGIEIGCDLNTILAGILPGTNDNVTISASNPGLYRLTFANDLIIKSLNIVGNASSVNIAVAAGKTLSVSNTLSLTSNTTLAVAGKLNVNGKATIDGLMNITNTAVFNNGFVLGSSGTLRAVNGSIIIGNSTTTLNGLVYAYNRSIIDFTNTVAQVSGTFIAGTTSRLRASTSEIYVSTNALINGTIELVKDSTLWAGLQQSGNSKRALLPSTKNVTLTNVIASGLNNTINSVQGTVATITQNLTVANAAALKTVNTLVAAPANVAGNLTVLANTTFQQGVNVANGAVMQLAPAAVVLTNAQTIVAGTFTALDGSVLNIENSVASFTGPFIASTNSTLRAAASLVTLYATQNTIGGVQLANDVVLSLQAPVYNITSLTVTGVNNTINGLQGTVATVANNLEVAATGALKLATDTVVMTATNVYGNLTFAANNTLNNAVNIAQGAVAQVVPQAKLVISNATAFVNGTLNAAPGTVLRVVNSTVTVVGTVVSDLTTNLTLTAAKLYTVGQQTFNATTEVVRDVYIQAQNSTATFTKMAVTGANNTVATVDNGLVQIQNLTVNTLAGLELAGATLVTRTTQVLGNLTVLANATFAQAYESAQGAVMTVAPYAKATFANATALLNGTLSAAPRAVIEIVNSTGTIVGAVVSDATANITATASQLYLVGQKTINGTVLVARNVYIQAQNSTSMLSNMVVTGLNNTVSTVAGGFVQIQNLTVNTLSGLELAGATLVSRTTQVLGNLSIVANSTFTQVVQTAQGAVMTVAPLAKATIANATALLNGTLNAAPQAVFEIVNSTGTIVGAIISDATTNLTATASQLYLVGQKTFNGTMQVTHDVYIQAQNNTAMFSKMVVTGLNNTVSTLGSGLVQIQNLTVNTLSGLELAGATLVSRTTQVLGNLSVLANSTFTQAVESTQGAVMTVAPYAKATFANATALLNGTLSAAPKAVVEIVNSTGVIVGDIVSDATANLTATASQIWMVGQKNINATVQTARDTLIQVQNGTTVFTKMVATGVNNTLTTVAGLANVTELVVNTLSSLELAGATVVSRATTVLGNLTVSANSTFNQVFNVARDGFANIAPWANLTLQNATALLNGTLSTAPNTAIKFVESSVTFVGPVLSNLQTNLTVLRSTLIMAGTPLFNNTIVLLENTATILQNGSFIVDTLIVDGVNNTVYSLLSNMPSMPTNAPTTEPTASPAPTAAPTTPAPTTRAPTVAPTSAPTVAPTPRPTTAPWNPPKVPIFDLFSNISSIINRLTITPLGELQMAVPTVINQVSNIYGNLSVGSNTTLNRIVTIASGATMEALPLAKVIVNNATMSLEGRLVPLAQSLVELNNSTLKVIGEIAGNTTSTIYTRGSQIVTYGQQSINSTVELAYNSTVLVQQGSLMLSNLTATGVNNTLNSVTGAVTRIKELTVNLGSTLVLLREVLNDRLATIRGELSVVEDIYWEGYFFLDYTGYLVLQGANATFTNATAKLEGTVLALNSTVMNLNNSVVTLAGDLRSGVDSTIIMTQSRLETTGQTINATVQLLRDSQVVLLKNATQFASIFVDGLNNTITSEVKQFQALVNNLTVASKAVLELATYTITNNLTNIFGRLNITAFTVLNRAVNVAQNATMFVHSTGELALENAIVLVNGTLQSAPQAVMNLRNSTAEFVGKIATDLRSNFTMIQSTARFYGEQVFNSSVELLRDASLRVQNGTLTVYGLTVRGVNNTVSTVSDSLAVLKNNVTVLATGYLTYAGHIVSDAVTIAYGGINITSIDLGFGNFSTEIKFLRSIAITGPLIVESGAQAIMYAQNFINGTTSFLRGSSLVIADSLTLITKPVIAFGNTTIIGTLSLANGATTFVQQEGALILQTGTLVANMLTLGTISPNPDLNATTILATLRGSGIVIATIRMGDSVTAIGFSPGIIQVQGDVVFTANSTVELEMANATNFDQMVVSGSVTRAGRINISLLNGYVPAANTKFAFLTHASATGTFGSINNNLFTETDSQTSTVFTYTAGATGAPTTAPTPTPTPTATTKATTTPTATAKPTTTPTPPPSSSTTGDDIQHISAGAQTVISYLVLLIVSVLVIM